MENKWEYDYSNLYNNQPQTQGAQANQNAAEGQYGAPDSNGQYSYVRPQPQPPVNQEPPKKKGGAKKVLTRVAALVLVAAIGFGSGCAGAYLYSKNNQQTVIYQSAPAAETEPAASAPDDGGVTTVPSTVSDADGEAADFTDVSAKVLPSVVAITTEQVVQGNTYWFGGQYVQSGAGSGVIMSSDGYIITNNHVVEGASNIKVTLEDGTEYDATLVGADSTNDIAVVKIEATDLTPAVMGDSDTLQVGENVIAVGNPMGVLASTVTDGIISALDRDLTVENQTMSLIQTSAAISPGNSGGGLFNMNGELIGIVNAKSSSTEAEGLGFAIPINTALKAATDLINTGYVTGRPVLGVKVVTVSDEQTAAQYGVDSLGIYIAEITAGGGAEKAGLQVGDRIVAIEGKMVESTADVTDEVGQHEVGDTVTLQIARDGNISEYQVTLNEYTGD